MRCEYYWYVTNHSELSGGRFNASKVQCENEATESTDLPSAIEYNTKNVCADCLKRIKAQEYVLELVKSSDTWEDKLTDNS